MKKRKRKISFWKDLFITHFMYFRKLVWENSFLKMHFIRYYIRSREFVPKILFWKTSSGMYFMCLIIFFQKIYLTPQNMFWNYFMNFINCVMEKFLEQVIHKSFY